ncbi:DUF6875 domain-containing protein [Nostoc sp. UHCC 0302]|uniref:DUF6875 domain-containing protein n=1 Tax=Nostoc sp. UHCC 0302 TaxID=3134896 RepID=UPI00311CCFFC
MKLYTPSEIDQLQQELPYLVEIRQWLKSFVARPHPDVGRPGTVCPFVPRGLKLNYIRLKVIRDQNLVQQQIAEIVLPYLNTFQELEPTEGDAALSKAILFIFPNISPDDAPRLIDSVQKQLKPFFVESGLMLGEFHNRTESPGLHNPNFRPLRSPIPMLVIRPMTEADLTFLIDENPYLRIKYLEAYLKHMKFAYVQEFEQKIRDESKLIQASELLASTRAEIAIYSSIQELGVSTQK